MKIKLKFWLKDNFYILFIMFALFGALATVQIRSIISVQRESAETLDINRLKSQLEEKVKVGEKYKEEIEKLENDKEAFLALPVKNTNNTDSKNQLEYLKTISALTDVKGEGVEITLNDAADSESGTISSSIIHDSDILNVVNQLRFEGALAISINNERIISTSEQLCSGPTIKINNNRYAVPYVIKAVSNSDTLYNAMKNNSILQEMIQLNKRVTITHEKEIIIPKFANDINGLISRLEVVGDEG